MNTSKYSRATIKKTFKFSDPNDEAIRCGQKTPLNLPPIAKTTPVLFGRPPLPRHRLTPLPSPFIDEKEEIDDTCEDIGGKETAVDEENPAVTSSSSSSSDGAPCDPEDDFFEVFPDRETLTSVLSSYFARDTKQQGLSDFASPTRVTRDQR